MKVELINYTGYGSPDPARQAAELLVFTKGTRLNMDAGRMENIQQMPWSLIEEELTYMANTIPSSWEFVDYTFLMNDVTRAFTHQQVRTRTASFAQQTMRVLNKSGWTYGAGPSIEHDVEPETNAIGEAQTLYHDTMATISAAYDMLIELGVEIEDARGILPTNIHTNIVAKYNLRTLCDTFRKRASGRTQGEYRMVVEAMKAEVLRVHPWAQLFIEREFDVAAAELEAMIREIGKAVELTGMPQDTITQMLKRLDQLRMMA